MSTDPRTGSRWIPFETPAEAATEVGADDDDLHAPVRGIVNAVLITLGGILAGFLLSMVFS